MTKSEADSPSAADWLAWLQASERRQRDVFLRSPERLIAEYRGEQGNSRGYHGREILELLQNAGDAAHEAGIPGEVRIVVTKQGLVVGNTGQPFDTGGVQSLLTANLSPKRQRDTAMIGDKGLGFRSILNWTRSPLISSGHLGLAFTPEYAASVVDELEASNAELARMVAEERQIGGDLIAPRLAFPQWVPDWSSHAWPKTGAIRAIAGLCASLRDDGFDTVVGMPFHAEHAFGEAVQQLKDLRPEFLLLVESITKLEVRIEGREPTTWSCRRVSDRASILEGERELGAWTVTSHSGEVPSDRLERADARRGRFHVTLAVPEGGAAGPGVLFSFFPTEVGLPLPLLVHVTVDLSETRKHLNDSPANRYILGVAAEQIAILAEKQASQEASDSWAGCRLVTPKGSWGSDLEKFAFPAALKSAARERRLIPVLGGGHCIAHATKLPPGERTDWWPARLFPELVSLSAKDQLRFARHFEICPLGVPSILERLLESHDLTLEERARCIAGLVASGVPLEGDQLACLLCDAHERPLPAGTSAILQPGGEMPELPKWATIRFLHSGLRRLLSELLDVTDSRELQQLLKPFGVIEYSLSAMIRPVLAEANRQVRERPSEEMEVRREAFLFLWRVYGAIGGNSPFPSEATPKLLNQEGTWIEPRMLYLGEGYGVEGSVTQDLYGGWAKEKLAAGPQILGLHAQENDTEAVASFLQWIGVERWPREIGAEKIDAGYVDAVKASLRYPVDFQDRTFSTIGELAGASVEGAKTLDGISQILNSPFPGAVLSWLAHDSRAVMWSRVAKDHGRLKMRPPYAQNDRRYSGPILSYIHWQIATTAWLPCSDGAKRAPNKCLIGDRQLEALFPSPALPDSDSVARYGLDQGVREAFRLAGVLPGLASLDRDDLYRLLLDVPTLSPDGKAAKALYRWMLENERSAFGSPGPHRDRYLQSGKVWGVQEGRAGYWPIGQLRHVDQEGFPPALLDKLPIADLPKRIGSQKVQEILGIKPLELSEIQPELRSHRPSPHRERWAEWFQEAKPFIRRLRQSQTKQAQSIGTLDHLQLVVCDELIVRMTYADTTYERSADEAEGYIFSDCLYVRGDPDDSQDLLSDAVGAAVARLFGMADGDAFAKILRCDPGKRSKLLKRMCGDEFHVEVDAAQRVAPRVYGGPIADPASLSVAAAPKASGAEAGASPSGEADQNSRPLGVTQVPHVPSPLTPPRALVIRNIARAQSAPPSKRTPMDGKRCEQMAAAFEEQSHRWPLIVGHITGVEAPGVDVLSFDTKGDREAFINPDTRDLSKVCRFIEVKGRSSSTAKIELRGNELRAAREHRQRYFLYRFFEGSQGYFHVSILQDPMASEDVAQETIIAFDLDRATTTQRFDFVVDLEDPSHIGVG